MVAISDEFAEHYLREGDLLPVLPDWKLPDNSAWAVFPDRRLMPRRTRAFLDAINQYLSTANCEIRKQQIQDAKVQYFSL